MFINDFEIKVHLYGDANNFGLLTIEDSRSNSCNPLPYISIPIENVTPSAIGDKVREYIENNLTMKDTEEEQKIDESKGWTVTFYSWDDGKPRVAGRFDTTAEKDEFIQSIHKPDSGWTDEELSSVGTINDKYYMLPL